MSVPAASSPDPLGLSGLPPVDTDAFRRAVGHFATGITVVTTRLDGIDHAMTASAFTSVSLEPCHHRSSVGPMAGVVTPSMWMFVLEDAASGRRTFCTLNEGLGKVLRYGAYSPHVLSRLRWMSDVLGPLLQAAVRTAGPVDVTAILAQMLQMGDEAHNRNRAGTSPRSSAQCAPSGSAPAGAGSCAGQSLSTMAARPPSACLSAVTASAAAVKLSAASASARVAKSIATCWNRGPRSRRRSSI